MKMSKFVEELEKARKEWAPLEERLRNETYAAKLREKTQEKVTTIKIHEVTRERLLTRRAYPTETYESIIARLLS